MYQDRYSKSAALAARRRRVQKRRAMLLSLALVGVLSVGGTLAWITASTNEVKNTFTPAVVESNITEEFDENDKLFKENVAVKNVVADENGGIPVYIRAAVIVNWVATDGSGAVSAEAPVLDKDYAIEGSLPATDGWVDGGDGFCYYTEAVAPGASTTNLINRCVQLVEREGYKLHVDIVSSAIQATPDEAVEEAWTSSAVAVDANNGTLTVTKK